MCVAFFGEEVRRASTPLGSELHALTDYLSVSYHSALRSLHQPSSTPHTPMHTVAMSRVLTSSSQCCSSRSLAPLSTPRRRQLVCAPRAAGGGGKGSSVAAPDKGAAAADGDDAAAPSSSNPLQSIVNLLLNRVRFFV